MSGLSKQRVIAALKNTFVDRVPHFEWLVDKKVIEALMPGADRFAFYEEHMDAMIVDFNYDSTDLDDNRKRNEWGIIQEYSKEEHGYPIDGPIHNREDLEAYTPPAADKPGRCAELERVLEKYGDDKAVILHMNDIWSIPSRMMPFETYLEQIIEEPEFIVDLVRMTVDAQILLAEQAAKRGVQFVYTGDDIAYKHGPMISPAMFREMFFPELKRIIGTYRDLGFYVLKHGDGNMLPFMDMYLEAGINLFDPVDPTAGMDLGQMKRDYGKRVALKGNVNCASTLVFGSVDEVVAETRRCLEIGMPGGGYVVSSSNSIHSSVNPENYRAMLETIKEYGAY
jgi:uroporphyrinogen decarboxylase